MKINIARIISDCSISKLALNNQSQYVYKNRLKIQLNQHSEINKSLDFDSCIRNICNRVRSLKSAKEHNSPMLSKIPSKNLSLSEIELSESPLKTHSVQIVNYRNETKSAS